MFNTFITIVAMCSLEHTKDLLAYSSIIIKASMDYDDVPWLNHDSHFCRQAATKPDALWSSSMPPYGLSTLVVQEQRALSTMQEIGSRVLRGGQRANPYSTTPVCRK